VTFIPLVIAWAFTLTFVIALILVLLDVAGIRRIQDEGQRKWLFRSLFGSVILAVVGFGTWQFEAFREPSQPAVPPSQAEAKADPAPTPTPARPEPAGNSIANATPAANPTPSPDPRSPTDPEVAAWATATLGARPVVPAAFDTAYPACVAELRARAFDAIDPADASECRARLSDHHVRYIVGFYRAKEAYDRALRSHEAALRRGGIQESERARYNFVVAENEDFNDPGGPTLSRIEASEARIQQDMAACRTRRCTRGS
jgi:hypothetical protein